MTAAPKLTIVTPVLNGERYILDLINSLRRQSVSDWEHVIVDGGSTDTTIDILQRTYRDDERFRLVEAPGLGLYPSLLRGIEASRGDIIGWQNADDFYTNWAFRAVCEYQERTQADWFTGFPGCWDDVGTLRFVRPYGWYPSSLIRRGWFHLELLGFLQQESTFFTRKAFQGLSRADLNRVGSSQHAGDFVLWRILAKKHKLSVIPTVLSGFRRHNTNRSVSHMEDYMREVRADGGLFLPPVLAGLSRRLFRSVSACMALPRAEAEDQAFQSGLDNA